MGLAHFNGCLGDLSADMANAAAKEAFIHGVADKEAAFITMSQNPDTLDDALAFLKQVIHDKKSLAGWGKLVTKVAQNVSFLDIPESIEPVICAAVLHPHAPGNRSCCDQVTGGYENLKGVHVRNAGNA